MKLKEVNAIRLALLSCFIFFIHIGLAQSLLDNTISYSAQNRTIEKALLQISKLSEVEITFSQSFFENQTPRNFQFHNTPLGQVLETILSDTNIAYKYSGQRILLYRKKTPSHTINGYIHDKNTGERLISATVFVSSLKKGVTTNEYGFFSLTIPQGKHQLECRYIGYQPLVLEIDLHQNIHKNISLHAENTLGEVIVVPKSIDKQAAPAMGSQFMRIEKKSIKYSPTLGGAADPIRNAQLLAGIQSGTDGLDGIYVRGGDSGQNLMLLDGVTVYIPYHLLGVFSVYNPDIINANKLFKGRFPAKYGGRIASVFDIRTREGNQLRWSGRAGSNLIGSNILIEGPLKKNKSALLLASRFSHSGFLLNPFLKRTYFNTQTEKIESSFADFNAKINVTLSPKNRLYASFYHGQDGIEGKNETLTIENESDVELHWRNSIASIRWNHLFNDQLFANTTLTYSFFDFEYAVLEEEYEEDDFFVSFIDIYSNNKDWGAKIDFDYFWSNHHHIRFGGGLSYKHFVPTLTIWDEEDEIFDDIDDININALQTFRTRDILRATAFRGYIEDEIHLSEQWQFNVGLHGSIFWADGKNYFRLEPRLFTRYQVNSKWSVYASFNKMVQYLHLISQTSIRLPNDIWMPSDANFRPQEAWQSELGINYSLSKHINLLIESYHKKMRNLYTFTENNFLDSDEDFRTFLVQGEGTSKGIECTLEYKGKKQGINLSYARTESTRQFAEINNGEVFPHARDYPDQIKLFAYQKIGKQWHVGLNWIYNTPGPAINVSALNELEEEAPSANYAEFLNAYHRLDINVQYQISNLKWTHTFNLGVYNTYDRKNLAYYRLHINADESFDYLPVYGIPFRPSFSYQIKF